MKQFAYLFRWDLIHLQRNQMIAVSVLVAAAYLGIFYLLRSLGNLEGLLIVMIFNDPIIMSYFFAGTLLLLEKDQRTLDALFDYAPCRGGLPVVERTRPGPGRHRHGPRDDVGWLRVDVQLSAFRSGHALKRAVVCLARVPGGKAYPRV